MVSSIYLYLCYFHIILITFSRYGKFSFVSLLVFYSTVSFVFLNIKSFFLKNVNSCTFLGPHMAGIPEVDSSGSTESLSPLSNMSGHGPFPLYIFSPAGYTTKLSLLVSMGTVGLLGFVGSCLILCFISSRRQALYLQSSRFTKNLNFYIQSLALSDMFSAIVSLPLTCVQIYFDLFQTHWACKIVRYINIVFPIITINNLVVIGMEKYLSLRRVPRTLKVSTVRKLIFLAWLAGFAITLVPAATFRGIRYDLNATHFTVICKYDREYLSFRLMFLSFTVVVYVLPSIFLIVVNISLVRTVWVKVKMTISIQVKNPIKARLGAAKIRGTFLLIAITFAFVIPYFAYLGYVTYNMLAKPDIDFQTDYIIRYASGVLAFSNSAINFAIYIVQMKDFRVFLKKIVCGSSFVEHSVESYPMRGTTLVTAQQAMEMNKIEPRDKICVK